MEDKTFAERFREELAKMKEMTWGARVQYFWDYYKVVLVILAAVIFVISTVVSVYHNMQLNQVFTTYWVNSNGLAVDTESIQEAFKQYLGGLGSKDVVLVDTSVMIDNEHMSQMTMASQMKLTTLIATGDIDLVLFDEEMYQQFLSSGGLMPVSEFCTDEQLKRWSDLLVEDTCDTLDDEGNTVSRTDLYAVLVNDSPVLKETGAYPEGNVYAVFVPAGKHPDAAAKFIDFLMDPAGAQEADA